MGDLTAKGKDMVLGRGIERDRRAIRPMVAPNVVRQRERPREHHYRYTHPGLGDDQSFDEHAAADQDLAKKCAEFFAKHYMAHHFCCDVSNARGYMKVYIPELMGAINGYVIHISSIQNHHDFGRKMHAACGEILERYKIPRAGFMAWDMAAALARAPIVGLQNAPVPE